MTASVPPRPSRAALYSDPINPKETATYGAAEVARMLGVGEQTLRDHVKRHGHIEVGDGRRIPGIRVMSRLRFAKHAVHAALSA